MQILIQKQLSSTNRRILQSIQPSYLNPPLFKNSYYIFILTLKKSKQKMDEYNSIDMQIEDENKNKEENRGKVGIVQIETFVRKMYMDVCGNVVEKIRKKKFAQKGKNGERDKIVERVAVYGMQAEKCLNKLYKKQNKRKNNKSLDQIYPQFSMKIKQLTSYSIQDFIQDLIETGEDVKLVWKDLISKKRNSKAKFLERAQLHFTQGHLSQLQTEQKISRKASKKSTKKVIKWYRQHLQKIKNKQNLQENLIMNQIKSSQNINYWSKNFSYYFSSTVYPNCIYMIGLTKGNGIIFNNRHVVSCAHVFLTEPQPQSPHESQKKSLMKIRCFITGNGNYGTVRVDKQGVYEESDVCFGEIVDFWGEMNEFFVSVDQIEEEKENEKIERVPCLQVGLLYIPDQMIMAFQTAEGFIQQNHYTSPQDLSLQSHNHNLQKHNQSSSSSSSQSQLCQPQKPSLGRLVHNCYGMWGTSGSPLFSYDGKLIGIHNSWNQHMETVSMIVHDSDDQDQEEDIRKCKIRVIRQYQRRAVGMNVIKILYKNWLKNKSVQDKVINIYVPINQNLIQKPKIQKTKRVHKKKRYQRN